MMADLALHSGDGVVALKDVAERQGISKKYLEQIVPLLNRAQLLRTNRGYKGGYTLSKDPSEYTVGEILRVTEGDLAPVSCLQSGSVCARRAECATLHIWDGLYKLVNDYFDNISLKDVVDEMEKLGDFENHSEANFKKGDSQ